MSGITLTGIAEGTVRGPYSTSDTPPPLVSDLDVARGGVYIASEGHLGPLTGGGDFFLSSKSPDAAGTQMAGLEIYNPKKRLLIDFPQFWLGIQQEAFRFDIGRRLSALGASCESIRPDRTFADTSPPFNAVTISLLAARIGLVTDSFESRVGYSPTGPDTSFGQEKSRGYVMASLLGRPHKDVSLTYNLETTGPRLDEENGKDLLNFWMDGGILVTPSEGMQAGIYGLLGFRDTRDASGWLYGGEALFSYRLPKPDFLSTEFRLSVLRDERDPAVTPGTLVQVTPQATLHLWKDRIQLRGYGDFTDRLGQNLPDAGHQSYVRIGAQLVFSESITFGDKNP